MADEVDDELVCATYTHARRHPMVLGDIGGWTPPFKLTMTQVVVLTTVWTVEVATWRWWSPITPAPLRAFVTLVLPCVLAWLARRARIEGRSLPRFVLGWLVLHMSPNRGQVGGRPYRPGRPIAPLRSPVYVAGGGDEP